MRFILPIAALPFFLCAILGCDHKESSGGTTKNSKSESESESKQTAGPTNLLDRHGELLFEYDAESNTHRSVAPDLFLGWPDQHDLAIITRQFQGGDRNEGVRTTIDLHLQRAAAEAMGGYKGAVVMVAPRTGGFLAAYATEDHSPFTSAFEPGGAVGVLTYALFLEHGGDVATLAPKKYPSNMTIDGKLFYDWTQQGQIDTIDEGVAVSSNLVFARMGMHIGARKIVDGFEKIFFDGPARRWGPDLYLGKIKSKPTNSWELAMLCNGLNHVETTTCSLAFLTAGICNDGLVPHPRFTDHSLSDEGRTGGKDASTAGLQLFSSDTAAKVRSAMRAAVTDKRGTARRAVIEGIDVAMVTGTSGNRPFDSVMIGFLPYEKPTIAFALYLHKGGKSEINGTRVAKALQESIRDLTPEYLNLTAQE